ncbi:translation elongation factor Ts [Parvibaculum sp.]|jgi:elongation factor Ts|uniref:translation elongation factor Ts n=1 Tax=Parvibaculum sp. TaxID=2024848 RepID=UPI000C620778|nr:translation elongation factor Ts [Parvibaculum sp.]MAU60679.1 elongation factor Ts [Parvibaculum sp.]MBO6667554.1 elongation factor Ts [Parvibaculum sp.]MBO6692116.1 elongation factor Ts [Parvibaculum sp.]MBO6714106.1 elongation factor Ts [Parvibaculum sp.]|tara:strand:+ start:4648 stop:5571 length:924 start_codon:yes stop_codon:yes gene_type:complete
MAEITASMVKELREKTGAGMMDCKSALNESGGDMEAAVDWLRTKGLAKAAKKAGRVAAEGLIGVVASGNAGAVVEVNSETDFVARNEQFQKMVSDIASVALANDGDFDKLVAAEYPGASKSVKDYVTEMVGTIGENMNVRRAGYISVSEGAVAAYVHNQVVPGLGKIGVLVGLESAGDKTKLAELGRQIAMHIAATNPLATRKEELDPAVVERERNVLIAEAKESGRPDNIIEKMVEGRIRKFFEEVVLLSQAFVVNPDDTVEKAVKAAEADIGAPINVVGFVRFALGEGIEKEESDFAAEVAAARG